MIVQQLIWLPVQPLSWYSRHSLLPLLPEATEDGKRC